jgi:hypothetical protein
LFKKIANKILYLLAKEKSKATEVYDY